jgi:2-polyprenyl-6-methoxyphenol hydroxylase-like FAD-dependent oxidoreductase
LAVSYDVIVVGARCAGAPTAMLLAQRGHRVLLLDADRVPSDMPMSTHLVWQSGAARLHRWGLLDRVAQSNCPPVRHCAVDLGPVRLVGEPPGQDGILDAYSPRRVVLDRILADAAVAAGAELREATTVTDLLREGEAITGVRATVAGTVFEERARMVIGADGRHSRVAQVVGAPSYNEAPPLQGTYFTYWRNLPVSGLELYVREHRAVYAWATNDALTLVGVNWTAADFRTVSQDVRANYLDVVASCAPGLRARLQQAEQQGRFIGGAIANFMRKPFGPGWALVGDAGLTVDPCTAAGINNAFRDVDTLVAAVDDGLSGRRPMPEALADYHSQRDAASTPIYDFACQLAPFAPPPPEMMQLFAALAQDPAETDRFLGLFAQTVSPVEFFAASNLQRIVGVAPRV